MCCKVALVAGIWQAVHMRDRTGTLASACAKTFKLHSSHLHHHLLSSQTQRLRSKPKLVQSTHTFARAILPASCEARRLGHPRKA